MSTSTTQHREEYPGAAPHAARSRERQTTPSRARESAPYVRWGVATGALGAFVIAVFFLIIDLFAGRPLATPNALGAMVFLAAPFDLSRPLSIPLVVGYTAIHAAWFVALASIASVVLLSAPRRAARVSGLSAILFAAFFGALTALFLCFVALFDMGVWSGLGGGKVLLANLLAAAAMAVALRRALPHAPGAQDESHEATPTGGEACVTRKRGESSQGNGGDPIRAANPGRSDGRRRPRPPAPFPGQGRRDDDTTKTISAGRAEIPALGLGTWMLEGQTCADRVADALAAGYRHIDTAQAYGNHEAVGTGIARSGVEREKVFLTSKLWFENLDWEQVMATTEASLEQLGTDYLDLLLVHWPNATVPLEETLGAMLEIQAKGMIRYLGVSNFPPSWVERAAKIAPVVCDQVEYHPLLSQSALLGTLRERDIALVAHSPLAHGELLEHPALREIAREHERSVAQVALRWLVSQEGVAAIPKAASREHLEQNLRVFDFELDEEEVRRIDALAEREGERTVDPDFAPAWEH